MDVAVIVPMITTVKPTQILVTHSLPVSLSLSSLSSLLPSLSSSHSHADGRSHLQYRQTEDERERDRCRKKRNDKASRNPISCSWLLRKVRGNVQLFI